MSISSDDKLYVYNRALHILGSRQLASLSENREPRRVMDRIWGGSGEVVRLVLEKASWNFALRSSRMSPQDDIELEFGWAHAFQKPPDLCRLDGIGSDPAFYNTFTASQYVDEGGFWLANVDELYVRYVSSDADFGFGSALWTESFKEYLAHHLAFHACERLTGSRQKKDDIGGEMIRALGAAKSNDGMGEGTKFMQPGSWLRSRSTGSRSDRGSRTRLIG